MQKFVAVQCKTCKFSYFHHTLVLFKVITNFDTEDISSRPLYLHSGRGR